MTDSVGVNDWEAVKDADTVPVPDRDGVTVPVPDTEIVEVGDIVDVPATLEVVVSLDVRELLPDCD